MISFEEIKDRKIIRWAVAYLAAAWAVLQVVQFMATTYNWPPVILRLLPILLGAGLLAVLVLAWYHGEKGAQKVSAVEIALLSGILVIAGSAIAIVKGKTASVDVATADTRVISDQSIAVLPLTNMSPDPNDAFFADGIHDEILTHLARVAALDVRSRTSVLEYRNTEKKIPQIARELSVRYVMEGSVRRAGDQARITVQLIDANTDKHKWAETYDGKLADVFAMQTTVAKKIAATLEAELTSGETELLSSKPTTSTDAYDLYLRARDYGQQSYGEDDYRTSLRLLAQAIELDPNFAQAYAQQSEAYSGLFWFHFDRSPEVVRRARETAQKAIQLNPQLAEAHLALSNYYYRTKLDFDAALKEVKIARELAPNNSQVALVTGAIYRRQGNMNGALSEFLRMKSLDPRSPLVALNIGETYRLMRRFDEATNTFNHALNINPKDLDLAMGIVMLGLYHTGDMSAGRAILTQMNLPTARSALYKYGLFGTRVELFDRKPDAAIKILEASTDSVYATQFEFVSKSLLLAQAHLLKKDAAQARAAFTQALATAQHALTYTFPDDPRVLMMRAQALSGLGRHKEAIADAERAANLLPPERDVWRGALLLKGLAKVLADAGESDRAIAILERLLKMPSDLSAGSVRADPQWDSLRSNPRFQKLIASTN